MNISSIEIKLAANDIISIITDYVKVNGLSLNEVFLDDAITLKGCYTKGIRINFQIACKITGVKDNVISMNLISIHLGKVTVFNFIKNMVLNKLMKGLAQYGIMFKEGTVFINLKQVFKLIPFHLNLTLQEIALSQGKLHLGINNLGFSMIKTEEANNIEAVLQNNHKPESQEKTQDKDVVKVEDGYTKARKRVQDKSPDRFKGILEYAMIMPDIIALLYRLFRDKRVEIKTKLLVGGALAYLASPLEILPDFIPFIGKIDDIALAFYILNKIINEVSEEVIIENWQGKDDIIVKIKEGVEFINKMAGGANVAKLFNFLGKLSSRKEKDVLS